MQQTVYKLSIGNTLSRYSCAGTMSFCQRYMAYLVQVVCDHKFNASVMQNIINHAIGCYPCLFCIIASDKMAPLFQSEGMPQEGPLRQCVLTISTMSQQEASEEMHKSFLIASHCLYSISQFHRYMYKILNVSQTIGSGVSRISARGVLKVRPHTKSGGGGGGGGGRFRSDIRKVGGGGGAIPLQVRYLWAHRKYLHDRIYAATNY